MKKLRRPLLVFLAIFLTTFLGTLAGWGCAELIQLLHPDESGDLAFTRYMGNVFLGGVVGLALGWMLRPKN